MRPFVESELVRTPLEEICLQCKRVRISCHTVHFQIIAIFHIFDIHSFIWSQLQLAPGGPDDPNGIPAFLSKAMTPPHS